MELQRASLTRSALLTSYGGERGLSRSQVELVAEQGREHQMQNPLEPLLMRLLHEYR